MRGLTIIMWGIKHNDNLGYECCITGHTISVHVCAIEESDDLKHGDCVFLPPKRAGPKESLGVSNRLDYDPRRRRVGDQLDSWLCHALLGASRGGAFCRLYPNECGANQDCPLGR